MKITFFDAKCCVKRKKEKFECRASAMMTSTVGSASANLLSVTRCNISFGARGFRSAAPAIWNSLPCNVRSCETLTIFRGHLKSHLFHLAVATA